VSKENLSQSWDPERFERNAGFVGDLGAGVMEPLAPQAEECILDLGCGHGKLTEKLVACGTSVLAVDASAEQVKGARDRGLDAHVADATKLTFKCEFDAVFSNAVLHWVKDVDAAIAEVKQALVPGGRFVGEFGGEGNVARVALGVERAMEKKGVAIADFSPWCFPSCKDYGACLESAGFKVAHIKLFQRPTPFPGKIDGWLETFGECFFNSVAAGDREALLDEVREDLARDLKDVDDNWIIDYVCLHFHVFLP
jgi:SAM-dependent methyltransferase